MRALIGLCLASFFTLAPSANAQGKVKIDALRAAATAGDAKAQYILGLIHELGEGVPQDYTEARKWYLLAAKQGYFSAQNNLGAMYLNGDGVPQNLTESRKWFNLAAAQGDDDAAYFRDEIAGKMTPAQLAEAQKLAREWTAAHPE